MIDLKRTAFWSILIGGLLILFTVLTLAGRGKTVAGREEIRGVIVSTDDSALVRSNLARIGVQRLELRVTSGSYKGQVLQAESRLNGRPQWDCWSQPGDRVLATVYYIPGASNTEADGLPDSKLYESKEIGKIMVHSQDRRAALLLLALAFSGILILFAAFTGVRALFSFAASGMVIWFLLLPGLNRNLPPLPLVFAVIILLSLLILFSVAGWSRKGFAAFFGTLCGLFLAALFTVVFGGLLKLSGMTLPWSEQILMRNPLIPIRSLFYGSILLGASGAAMDVAIDIAASLEELHLKRPDLCFKELYLSGVRIGRSVIGTMTTTLLLAYSGGYISLMLFFHQQASSPSEMFNLKIVAAEILRTLAGSTGLILVAPMTSLFAALLFGSGIPFKDKVKNQLRLK